MYCFCQLSEKEKFAYLSYLKVFVIFQVAALSSGIKAAETVMRPGYT
jgi:hypothetical protein